MKRGESNYTMSSKVVYHDKENISDGQFQSSY